MRAVGYRQVGFLRRLRLYLRTLQCRIIDVGEIHEVCARCAQARYLAVIVLRVVELQGDGRPRCKSDIFRRGPADFERWRIDACRRINTGKGPIPEIEPIARSRPQALGDGVGRRIFRIRSGKPGRRSRA